MLSETARQCLREMGFDEDRGEAVAGLLAEEKLTQARQRLRCLRCELMEHLHDCQRRVDRMDWLIREIEKANQSK